MYCPSCGNYTDEGQFCTHCGKKLYDEETPIQETNETSLSPDNYKQGENIQREPWPDRIKKTFGDFGHFFNMLLKSPAEAKRAHSSDMISGLMTMILFALLLATGYFISLNVMPIGFYQNVSWLDHFIFPFILFMLLEYVIASMIFISVRLASRSMSYPIILAQYGAYLVPLIPLLGTGIILNLIGLQVLALIFILVSLLGMLLLIPAFIIMSRPAEGFDRIYIMLGYSVIVLLIFSLLVQSLFVSLVTNMMQGFGS